MLLAYFRELLALCFSQILHAFDFSVNFQHIFICTDRSSRLQMFFKIDAIKSFTNFTGKQLCWSLFLIKSLFSNTSGGCFCLYGRVIPYQMLYPTSGLCFNFMLYENTRKPFEDKRINQEA